MPMKPSGPIVPTSIEPPSCCSARTDATPSRMKYTCWMGVAASTTTSVKSEAHRREVREDRRIVHHRQGLQKPILLGVVRSSQAFAYDLIVVKGRPRAVGVKPRTLFVAVSHCPLPRPEVSIRAAEGRGRS